MLNKLRNIGKESAVYGLGNVLNKLLGFILIPLYNNHISIDDFGILSIFEISIMFLSVVLNFGIHIAHQRFFYIEKNNGTYGKFLFNCFVGNLLLAFTAILPLLIFSNHLSGTFFDSQNQTANMQIALWIILIEVLYNYPLQILQFESKPFQFLLLNAFKLILSFGLTIYLVKNFAMGINGILNARLAGALLSLLFALFIVIIPKWVMRFDFKVVLNAIRFGFPLIISTIATTVFLLSDRYMLKWLSTDAEVGKYGFGLKIANFINLIFIQTIGLSYFPSVMKSEGAEDNTRYYRKMLTYYCFLIALIILSFLFFYRDILSLIVKNKDYWEGLNVVPFLSLSFMIMGMNYFVGVGLFLSKKTNYYIVPSFMAAVINFCSNFLLIPRYGMIGAGISVILAQIVYTSILSYLAGRQLKIGFEWKKVFSIYAIAFLIFFGDRFLTTQINSIVILYFARVLLLGFFVLILYKLNFFEPIEIQRFFEGLQKLLKRFKLVKP